jgi:hypothetical protein
VRLMLRQRLRCSGRHLMVVKLNSLHHYMKTC